VVELRRRTAVNSGELHCKSEGGARRESELEQGEGEGSASDFIEGKERRAEVTGVLHGGHEWRRFLPWRVMGSNSGIQVPLRGRRTDVTMLRSARCWFLALGRGRARRCLVRGRGRS
jgi:hypothetical protein